MKKLFTLMSLAAVTLLFSGCLKSGDDGRDKELELVLPGIYIYNAATNQNTIALQQANIGLRFAMLQAEANEQSKGLLEVTVGSTNKQVNLFKGLFGNNATLTDAGEGVYEIKMSQSDSALGFYCDGTFVVTTGAVTLDATSQPTAWVVSLKSSDPVHYSTGVSSNALNIYQTGGTTELYNNGASTYAINPSAIACYISGFQSRVSAWSGNYTWSVAADNLTYTDNAGKLQGFGGYGIGDTFNSFDNSSPTAMSYGLESGKYLFGRLVSGEEICSLTDAGDYDDVVYPASYVDMDTTMTGEGSTKTITQRLIYNTYVYSSSYTLTINN